LTLGGRRRRIIPHLPVNTGHAFEPIGRRCGILF